MEKDLMKKKFGLPPMPPIGPGAPPKRNIQRKRDYSPVEWGKYFEKQFNVDTGDGNVFCAYSCGNEGPVLLFLHGGGFSALSWALLSAQMVTLVKCQCVAIDQRGHGDTTTTDNNNLSAEQLSSDIGKIVSHMYPNDVPPIILVGHSMGGAIAVHVADRNLLPTLLGLVVIDVVEGTAIDALSSMQSLLRNRPKTFKSIDFAIEWAVRSGQIQNLSSAKVSMTGQIKCMSPESDEGKEAAVGSGSFTDAIEEEEEEEVKEQSEVTNNEQSSHQSGLSSISQSTSSASSSDKCQKYTWRIDLSKTEQFWRGWFTGLSQKFLSCSPAKMLILAGHDRLDKDLTIGQMQGKFQMNLLPQCGHAVHEDVPEKVAEILAAFMTRHKVAESLTGFERSVPGC